MIDDDTLRELILANEERKKINLLPCPLCGSDQVQLCLDYNNSIIYLAKCRVCKCQAPLSAWDNRTPE